MHIINLTPCEPGVYSDHSSERITAPPEGWAYIPDNFPLPSTYPRLGSLEAEEKTYTREVKAYKEVTKYRDTDIIGEDGKSILEEYTARELVTEEREYTMMTVTAMSEGTLPEPRPEPETTTTEDRIKALEDSKADRTTVDELSEALELLLSGDTGEEVASDEA